MALKRTAEDRRQWQRVTRAGSHYCFSADYLKKSWPTLTIAALQDVIISDAIMRGPHLTEGPLKTSLSAVHCKSCSSQCCNTFTCCLDVVSVRAVWWVTYSLAVWCGAESSSSSCSHVIGLLYGILSIFTQCSHGFNQHHSWWPLLQYSAVYLYDLYV